MSPACMHYVEGDEFHLWTEDMALPIPPPHIHPSIEMWTNATPDGTWTRLP